MTAAEIVLSLLGSGSVAGAVAAGIAKLAGLRMTKQVKEVEQKTAEIQANATKVEADKTLVETLTDQLKLEYKTKHEREAEVVKLRSEVGELRVETEECKQDKAEYREQVKNLLEMRERDMIELNQRLRTDMTTKIKTAVQKEIRRSTPSMPGVKFADDSGEFPLDAPKKDPKDR